MKDHIGLSEYGGGPGMWQTGLITTGAWREDMEDIVYLGWYIKRGQVS